MESRRWGVQREKLVGNSTEIIEEAVLVAQVAASTDVGR